jgi:glutamate/tyrosine decarboxylase-like PLP-dependent enzyme
MVDVQTVMDVSVRTAHPRMFNQLFSGCDLISMVGDWVTSSMNSSMYTHEMAPAFNIIENMMIQKMGGFCGWTEQCDGLFNPGGSISNLYAVECALHHYFPQVKTQGLFGLPRLVIFISAHSHYSMPRAATILGLGMESVRKVPVDSKGKFIPAELERMVLEAKANGERPFFACCTSGTTVMGAFDPILETHEICKKYDMWLHIDAAWGGAGLLSKKHKGLMNGIEHADSVTWNPHKLMGAHVQCAAFLVKDLNILQKCNSMNASYLFQQDKIYDVKYDTGDKTIQCGRKIDAFKLWLMWRAKGDLGFENHVNHLWSLADLLWKECTRRENFEMVMENPECTNVCFWYVPKRLQSMDKSSKEYKDELHKIAPKIKAGMMLNGSMMMSYQPLDDKPNFFRMVFCNVASQFEDVYFLCDEIERLGKDL